LRKGFGLIYALFVIVLVAGVISLALRYAKSSIIKTTNIYEKESAELFMNSAVELSLLAIQGYERNATNGCLKEVNITSADKRFIADVNITKYFLYHGVDNNGSWYNNCSDRNVSIDTEDSHGFVMLEITVETNATNPKNRGTNIRLLRRTLQRP
jgi:hypothetical protein